MLGNTFAKIMNEKKIYQLHQCKKTKSKSKQNKAIK